MTFASEVSILDIGAGGVSLRADKRLDIGGKYLLKLGRQEKVISVTCQVAWARMSGTKKSAVGETVPVYTAGMKFISLSPEHLSDLLGLVEAVGGEEARESDERRTHARYPVPTPGIALLNLPAEYKVAIISLSGMLIDCAEAVEPEWRVPMVLSLPDGPDIGFVGRVVSCLRVPETASYKIGIEFIDLTGQAREALSVFVAWLASLNLAQSQT
jgi:hypothetical protein